MPSSSVIGQLASQVLLEVGEPADHAAAIPLVLQVQRIVPKRESETREQPKHAKVVAFLEQAGQHRIAGVKRDADRDRLAVPQHVAGKSLELVRRPVAIVERPGRPGLERIAAVRDLVHVQLGAPPHHRVEGVGLKARQRIGLTLDPEKEIRIADQRDFHGLRHAAALFALGEHVEKCRVIDHREWRREGAEQILETEGVDGVLHADAGVVLREHRGGAADMAHATMKDRRREADGVEHGSAADRNGERLPVDLP